MVFRRIAFLFAALAAGIALYAYLTLPMVLRVAVGPEGSEQARFIDATAKALKDARAPVRFDIVSTAGSPDSSVALDGRRVDLAVLRSDDPTSQDALSVMVLHHRGIVVIGRADRGIATFSDLQDRRVVVAMGTTDSSRDLFERILTHYGIAIAALTEATIEDARDQLAAGTADALVLVAPPAGERLRLLVTALTKSEVALSFLDLPSAKAIANRFADLQPMEIPAGIFGGTPPLPPAALDSVAVTYELAATSRLSEKAAAVLTKALLDIRPRLRRAGGAAFAIEAPKLDEPRRFLPHPGTAAQLNDEMKTLLETYSDHIWLALFGFSILGSSVAAFFSWIGVQEPPRSASGMRELPGLLAEIRRADDLRELDRLQEAFDRVVMASVEDYAEGSLSDDDIDRAAWLGHVQGLIDRRRGRVEMQATAAPSQA